MIRTILNWPAPGHRRRDPGRRGRLRRTPRPARRGVVPRAIYFRYLKRIVANLLGVVSTATEPLPNIDYLDDGQTDITDD